MYIFFALLLFIINAANCQKCVNPGPNDPLPPGGITWQNCTKPHEFYTCGSACQNECNTLGDPCTIINIRCNDLCYCCPGYARDCLGNCIPEKACPPKGSCPKKPCIVY
ncbi:chymotrypsin-elastase inhibitor ixodidin [Sitophilus oryzae]|uniref:Chymotrypsin-elastase inhibitor ixodidin n=1 Tax=Sitophilus oryzae TaxID=7048 RepID=A0A6J2X7G9_SITOR|nr:chymotrypsin-elastase inhibitor ixodidin [Sitophilus oryzae]